jgi:hypothetical protein
LAEARSADQVPQSNQVHWEIRLHWEIANRLLIFFDKKMIRQKDELHSDPSMIIGPILIISFSGSGSDQIPAAKKERDCTYGICGKS